MQQIVSITSQGQITIPASMRRAISIDKYKKAAVSTDGKKIIIEPVIDLLELGGVLQKKAKKIKNIETVMEIEEKSIVQLIK